MKPPVKLNEQITVTITGIGKKGDGIAKKDKFAIIVPDTQLGNTYQITITRINETYAFGKKIEQR